MSSGLLRVRSQEYEIYDGSRLKDTREKGQKWAGKPSGCIAGLTPMGEIRREIPKEDWVGRSSELAAALSKSWPGPLGTFKADCM